MKKILMILTLIVPIFVLAACKVDPIDNIVTNEILNLIEIGFEADDNETSVTSDFTLVISLEGFDNVGLTWSSSDPDTIEIQDDKGIVHRKDTNKEVTLLVEVTRAEDTKYKYFNLIVLKTTSTEVDLIAPVITGAKDIEVEVGSDKPNYLAGVSATDNIDTNISVLVDDSLVDLTKEGTYDLTYTATDLAGNEASVTVQVTVTPKTTLEDVVAPVITGAQHIEVEAGSAKPNYLSVVSAMDDVDGAVEVFVDDSEVDLNNIGTYDLIYYALDQAGNRAEVIVQVVVIEKVIEGEETLMHQFEFTGELQHGYSDPAETSTIKDSITNTNFDIIKKRANTASNELILSGASEADTTAWIGFEFSQDVHKITFDASSWSSNDLNATTAFKLQTKIDGSWIDLEDLLSTLTLSKQAFEITDIAIDNLRIYVDGNIGSGNTARIKIDNLKFYHIVQISTEERNAQADYDALSIPTTFIDNTTINLPSTGLMGSDITWSYTNGAQPTNTLINLNTGAVLMPSEGQETVSLTATITNGTFIFNKVFNVVLGEGDPISIWDARSTTNESYVKTQGVITSLHKNDTQTFIFIKDSTAAVYIVAPNAETTGLSVGDEIEVKGMKLTANGQVYIGHIRGIEKLGSKTVTPLVVTSDQLNSNPAQLVSIFGLMSTTYNQTATKYLLYTNQGSFNIMIPQTVNDTDKLAIQNKLAQIDAGIHVLVVAPIFSEGATNYLFVTHADQVTVDNTIDFNEVSAVILNNILLPEISEVINEDIDLSHAGELLFGATITWTSSNPSSLSPTGEVTQGESDVVVTLTYTIYFDNEVVKTESFEVVVSQLSAFTGYYQSLSGKSGAALKAALTALIKNTGSATGSTSQVKTVDNYNGQNYNIYTGFGAYGNREHVWPNSKLGSAPSYDLHNLRAAVTSVNSSRSNYPFTNQVSGTQWQRIGSTFYPGSEHVGDVARIVLYISVRYGLNLNLVGNENMFLTWHEEDPVSDFELSRNGKIQNIQNNRNPFIDYPELVDVIFS